MTQGPPDRPLKLLLVSWYFPPLNAIAATRLGKFARFLEGAGVDLRTITAARSKGDLSQAVEVNEDRVLRTAWHDRDERWNPAHNLRRLRRRFAPPSNNASSPTPSAKAPAPKPTIKSGLKRVLSDLYLFGVLFPDRQAGWTGPLRQALQQAVETSRPDAIYVSGPPFSSFRAVADVARKTGVPWFAEIRDLWSDEAFDYAPSWRRALDRRLERQVLGEARGIVSVSPLWTDHYAAKYDKPALTVTNGFDPKDFDLHGPVLPTDGPLTLIHAGTVYAGRRDPTPLFEALVQGGFSSDNVRVTFLTGDASFALERATAVGAASFVEVAPPVAYADALRRQKATDVLLLLQWADPANAGNIPAKLFEYFALRRPVLGIGPDNGYPAALIRERQNGLFSTDPNAIAAQLRIWLEAKRAGELSDYPPEIHKGLTRDEQYAAVLPFISDLLDKRS